MATAAQWLEGARPRTLPAAIAPVAVGAGLAAWYAAFDALLSLLALVVAIALQVGVNYANDYSDGIRGTDRVRVGPVRLVGQGLAAPRAVKAAAFCCFGVGALAGLVLVWLCGQWWLVLVGAASIAAAWLYTGGPRPYGYAGLGEVFVFVFFGLVPVLGTVYVQVLGIGLADVVAAVGVGLLACAILVTNNLRDIPSDTDAGKRTLAVRIGDRADVERTCGEPEDAQRDADQDPADQLESVGHERRAHRERDEHEATERPCDLARVQIRRSTLRVPDRPRGGDFTDRERRDEESRGRDRRTLPQALGDRHHQPHDRRQEDHAPDAERDRPAQARVVGQPLPRGSPRSARARRRGWFERWSDPRHGDRKSTRLNSSH